MSNSDKLLVIAMCLAWMSVIIYFMNDLKKSVNNSIRSIQKSIRETRDYIKE